MLDSQEVHLEFHLYLLLLFYHGFLKSYKTLAIVNTRNGHTLAFTLITASIKNAFCCSILKLFKDPQACLMFALPLGHIL